ncbi:MAG: C45 family autoproteolytic acyltransferase/hydrolase [Planctomycetaceae bacterium]|nr:C45 family autoproteolytic acyltransferase/hydrolase [Planctomycetaceae bacterium]
MSRILSFRGCVAWMVFVGAVAASASDAVENRSTAKNRDAIENFSVAKTYNDAPFKYSMQRVGEQTGFRVYRLCYPSPIVSSLKENNVVPAFLYLPKGLRPTEKYPAVVCLHPLDANAQLTDLMCVAVAQRGVPALSIKLPYYGERGRYRGPEAIAADPEIFTGAVLQGIEDIRRAVDLLASRPEVNPDRIGVVGISLGGILAATVAGVDARFYRAELVLAGGDLPEVIRTARETRLLREMLERLSPEQQDAIRDKLLKLDPVCVAPSLRSRALAGRVLMINAAEDEVIPPACTRKLADALGIADRVVWFDGLGHYSAMAQLPEIVRRTGDFFAQDLPEQPTSKPPKKQLGAFDRLTTLLGQIVTMATQSPEAGRRHTIDLAVTIPNAGGKSRTVRVRIVRGDGSRFAVKCDVPGLGHLAIGQNHRPWMVARDHVFCSDQEPVSRADPWRFVDPQHWIRLRVAAGLVGGLVAAPDLLKQWIDCRQEQPSDDAGPVLGITAKDAGRFPGQIRIAMARDGETPTRAEVSVAGVEAKVRVHEWQVNAAADDAMFEPPERLPHHEVDSADLHHMFSAMANFAVERLEPDRRPGRSNLLTVAARDPAGHGLLAYTQGKRILFVEGTPEQMGAAHGALLKPWVQRTLDRTVYVIGGGDTLQSGVWFFDRMADIERRTTPHIPARFLAECDALSQAVGVSRRDGRYGNLFPERFHCSGVALRGKATVGGRVLHARVLDYLRDVDLQTAAVVQVFMPEGRYAWISHGYAGFIGSVTAMNEKGLAMGEMGGRGEGQWDGMPMSLLIRDVMERAATVDEAVRLIRRAPRTCEYYYVLSDRTGAMCGLECTPDKVTVLEPGQQEPRLPHVPEDAVLISGPDRAATLARRIEENYGRIDVARLIEILKRPVAMESNLHDAIFTPETLELWVSDAGRQTAACDEPYAHLNLGDLLRFYAEQRKIARKHASDAHKMPSK